MDWMPSPHGYSPFVEECWCVEGASTVALSGGVEMVFCLSGEPVVSVDGGAPLELKTHFLVGGLARNLSIVGDEKSRLLGVRFHPTGIFPYFSMPQMVFYSGITELDEVWELVGLGVAQAVCSEGPDVKAAYLAFFDFFCHRKAWLDAQAPAVIAAVAHLRKSNGDISVEALSERCGVGRRQLERLFVLRVGVTPKQLARTFRLVHALTRFSRLPFVDTAISCGFFDQSHLNRDCQLLVGSSPGLLSHHT